MIKELLANYDVDYDGDMNGMDIIELNYRDMPLQNIHNQYSIRMVKDYKQYAVILTEEDFVKLLKEFNIYEEFAVTEIEQLNVKRGNIDIAEKYHTDIFEALADKMNALEVAYALADED